MSKKSFIIDFDSTFIRLEALEEMARMVFDPTRDEALITEVTEITRLGMEGRITFDVSLSRRLKMLRLEKRHIEAIIKEFRESVSPSFQRNRELIRQLSDRIYIVTGGFREFVVPVVADFGIPAGHVFANTFIYDEKGVVTGYDRDNPLSRSGGKAEVVRRLNLPGQVYVLGDGYSDYEIKKAGVAHFFAAFTENVRREPVLPYADFVAGSFEEFAAWAA